MRSERAIWAVIVVGTVARLAVGLTSDGFAFERQSYELVRGALATHPLHVYALVNGGTFHYPYPPGYLPWIWLVGQVSAAGWHPFRDIVLLPGVAADAALAWFVQDELRRRGAAPNVRLAAAGLIALGPAFGIISAYHGLFDSVAILPAVVAVVLWQRMPPGDRRAVVCGLLVGLGGAIKTVPILTLVPLLACVRSPREAALLVGSAGGLVAASLAPFYLADPGAVRHLSKYGGVPGLGGLSLVVQPDLAQYWLTKPVAGSEATRWLVDHQKLVNGAAVAAVAAVLWRTRPDPVRGSVFLWLATWAFGTGFFFQYLIWGLPFLVLAGWLRAALVLELAVLGPTLIFYAGPWHGATIVYVFVGLMLAIWLAWLAGLGLLARSFWRAAAR